MKIIIALIISGLSLIAYAYTLSPYKDEKLFIERYMQMSEGQSEEYWKLRDEMLTPKYKIQDYGGTLISVGLCLFLFVRKGQIRLQSPKSRLMIIAVAVAAPVISVSAFVFDLLLGATRGEFPHWADSLGIPLMAVPVQFVLLLLWAIAHMGFLRVGYLPSAPLALVLSRKANLWLLFVSLITAILTVVLVAEGAYWYAIPCAVWLYIYLSLAASYRGVRDAQQGASWDAQKAARP